MQVFLTSSPVPFELPEREKEVDIGLEKSPVLGHNKTINHPILFGDFSILTKYNVKNISFQNVPYRRDETSFAFIKLLPEPVLKLFASIILAQSLGFV